MGLEQNLNKNSEEGIKNNEAVVETVPIIIPSTEDKQAKAEEKKQKEDENKKRIDEKREEVMKQFNGGNQEKNLDPFEKWKEKEIQKIKNKAEEMEGQMKGVAIADKGPVSAYDKNFALESLNNYGELKFIDFASKEGNQDDINYALKLVDSYYRDRDDLKTILIQKSNQK